jgi:hypothetical protein
MMKWVMYLTANDEFLALHGTCSRFSFKIWNAKKKIYLVIYSVISLRLALCETVPDLSFF